MINMFRNNANNWLMTVIFAIIIIVFVFTFGSWGGKNLNGELPIAALVNGRAVTMQQFKGQYSNMIARYRQFNPQFSTEDAEKMGLKDQTMDQLISLELLAQEAEKNGLSISDEEIIRHIKKTYFGEEPFDRVTYKEFVRDRLGTSEAEFEKQERKRLLAMRQDSIIRDAQSVPLSEVKSEFAKKHNRVNLEILRIKPQFFKDIAVSEAEAETYAKAHESEISAYFEKNTKTNNSIKEEERTLAIQRLKIAKTMAQEGQQQIKAKAWADSALAALNAGTNMEAITLEGFTGNLLESENSSTDPRIRDSGFFGQDSLFVMGIGRAPEVVSKAFKLTTDKPLLNEVVEVSGHFYVIKLKEKETADESKFAEEKEQIQKTLISQNGQKMFKSFIDGLRADSKIEINLK